MIECTSLIVNRYFHRFFYIVEVLQYILFKGGMISIMQSHVNVKKDKMKKTTNLINIDEKEPELRPEYVEKIKRMEKDKRKPIRIKNIDDLFVDE